MKQFFTMATSKKRGNLANFPTELRDIVPFFAATKRLLHRKGQIQVDLEPRRQWNAYYLPAPSESELNYRQQIKLRFKWKSLTSVRWPMVLHLRVRLLLPHSSGWVHTARLGSLWPAPLPALPINHNIYSELNHASLLLVQGLLHLISLLHVTVF